jgi:hypothetical protein
MVTYPLVFFSGIAVAGLFFWLTDYIWQLENITWPGKLAAAFFAFLGCFCLLLAFIFGTCTAHVGT